MFFLLFFLNVIDSFCIRWGLIDGLIDRLTVMNSAAVKRSKIMADLDAKEVLDRQQLQQQQLMTGNY